MGIEWSRDGIGIIKLHWVFSSHFYKINFWTELFIRFWMLACSDFFVQSFWSFFFFLHHFYIRFTKYTTGRGKSITILPPTKINSCKIWKKINLLEVCILLHRILFVSKLYLWACMYLKIFVCLYVFMYVCVFWFLW